MERRRPRRRWTRGVPIGDRGAGESYRPEDVAPSVFAARQPGIMTPVLDHLVFAAVDLSCGSRAELRGLLSALTVEAERVMSAEHRAPSQGHPAGGVTLTFGFGPFLFDERFGLASRRPVALTPLPAFPGDTIDASERWGPVYPGVRGDARQGRASAEPPDRSRSLRRSGALVSAAACPASVGMGGRATCSVSRTPPAIRVEARTWLVTSGSAAASERGTTTAPTPKAEPTPACCCCSTDAIPAANSSRCKAAG